MPISMDPSVRYVTQSSVYASMFTGPLTDRRISQLRKMGYYGNQAKLQSESLEKVKKARKAHYNVFCAF